ncbi:MULTISPECIES: hypothetical protein [Pseudomonas]|uniref:hypothetical protein n=1 Tax=Pseudomonas TaxID=286 RepID=UPI001022C1E0|nr:MULTISPECIES: hypothetical protein [Pseudomonas]MDO4236123.1 hypothetical protein [Pseudomonas sp.]RZI21719.1 hypothetical protein EUX53_16540 [Pseudomonas orientalis]
MASTERALKANSDDAFQEPHTRACLGIYAKSNPAFIQSSSLNDFYSGFLAAVSTDAGMVDPASAHHFTW